MAQKIRLRITSVAVVLLACGGAAEPWSEVTGQGGNDSTGQPGRGGTFSSGGVSPTTGGRPLTGGLPGAGGWSPTTGGLPGAGGRLPAGGSPGTGGRMWGGFPGTGGGFPASGGGFSTGGAPTGGTGSSGVGGTCCNAAPVCDSGDITLSGGLDNCPPNRECYSRSICCWTVSCVRCETPPTCNPGDEEIVGGTCPPGQFCYRPSLCGVTIACVPKAEGGATGAAGAAGAGGAECNWASEYNRNYVNGDPKACVEITYSCPGASKYISNECGCGCEQDPSCPKRFDCTPGQALSELCSEPGLARCPFTVRTY